MSFAVEIKQAHLEVVLRAIVDMRYHFHDPKIIDKTALMVSLHELETMIAKLKLHSEGTEAAATIPMNRHEWSDYTRLVLMADADLPALTQKDLEILEMLSETYSAWDDQGMTPNSP